MIELSEIRVFLCTIPTKMNYSFDTLMGLAQQIFDQDPLSGHLFLFVNHQRDRLKILFWDVDGLAIFLQAVGIRNLPAAQISLWRARRRTGRTPTEPLVDRTRFKNWPTTKAVSSRGLKSISKMLLRCLQKSLPQWA